MTNSTATDGSKSIIRFRWIGYGLLVFAFIDVLSILIPPQFTQPAWEFQVIGQLIERAPVPLIGMAMVFYGEQMGRLKLESLLIKLLSWATVLIALLFLLMVPLAITNTIRLNTQAGQAIDAQVQQQMAQVKQVQEQFDNASPEQLKAFAEQLQEQLPDDQKDTIDPNNLETLRQQVETRAKTIEAQVTVQATQEKTNRSRNLLKNSVKWSLGAIISSVLFFAVWKTTRWARQ